MGSFAVSSEGTKCMDCGAILPNGSKEAMYAHDKACTATEAKD